MSLSSLFTPYLNHIVRGDAMRVFVNSNETICEDGMSVLGLIRHLGLKPERVVVELNLEIIRAADFSCTVLREGDRLELLQFVGGG